VGKYVITPGGLSSDNYDITFVVGGLEITPRVIQVTADDLSKVYGDSDPALTYQITQGNLVAGDGFTGALVRVPGEDVGTYAIQQGTLALSGNYILTFVPGKLQITQAELPKTGVNEYKYYILGLMAMLLGTIFSAKSKKLTN
jgi:LPXTG-motif cell wall-anchored protein